MTSHPASALDDTVHQRARLGILTVLSEARRADFSSLRELLALTDGNLSRHLQVLEQAGHVRINKAFHGKRPRTTVSITQSGRTALAQEMEQLRKLVAQYDRPAQT